MQAVEEQHTMSVVIDPEKLLSYSGYDLLKAASRGRLGIDQRWIHALVDRPQEVLPDIVRFAEEDHTDDPMLLETDLVNIFQHLKASEGIPYLLRLIRAHPDDIQDEVVEALVVIGQPAVEPLLALYKELGAERGGEVAFLLAGLHIRDPRILEMLLSRLDVDWSDALFHLEVYADPEAIPELERRLASVEDEDKRQDLLDTIKDLNGPHQETHITDFNIWEYYPPTAPPEFDVLSEEEHRLYLNNPDKDVRTAAAIAFFGTSFSTETRAKLLELAKNDPDPEVRACCWEAFLDQTEEPELRRVMMERLGDPEIPNNECAGLALGLARHSDNPLVRKTILALAKDPETRERATEAMWRSFDDSFGPDVVKYINDPDEEVRRNAIWGIGYLQVTNSADLLKPFFKNDELRADALHNYALAMPGPTTRKKIHDLYEKISDEANGFTDGEDAAVKAGLDARLVHAGLEPVFHSHDHEHEPDQAVSAEKVGRNDPCPCGSGKKYKKCCGK
jgi:HEAT repeat protein